MQQACRADLAEIACDVIHTWQAIGHTAWSVTAPGVQVVNGQGRHTHGMDTLQYAAVAHQTACDLSATNTMQPGSIFVDERCSSRSSITVGPFPGDRRIRSGNPCSRGGHVDPMKLVM